MSTTKYNEDIIKWSKEQAQFLLTGQFNLLDLEHIADEILDVGKSEIRELESRTAVLLANLIKWAYQPTHRGRSWQNTIKLQRKMVKCRISRTPSLKSYIDEDFWLSAYDTALRQASNETNIHVNFLPVEMPWPPEQVLEDGWLPEEASTEVHGC